jgi:hypothetical protein
MSNEQMSNGLYNLMLDPSMFLTIADDERRLDVMMNRMDALARDGVALHVPQAFMSFVEEHYAAGDGATPTAWVDTYAPLPGQPHGQPPQSYELLYRKMNDRAELIRPFSPDRRLREEYEDFFQLLPQAMNGLELVPPYDGLRDSILQEWIFLQERSWIVARVRKAFDVMKAAGMVYVEVGKKALDEVVRKTRRLEEDEVITTLDRLKTLGEWVAVGGGAVAAGTFPPALAIIVALSPRLFALIDP